MNFTKNKRFYRSFSGILMENFRKTILQNILSDFPYLFSKLFPVIILTKNIMRDVGLPKHNVLCKSYELIIYSLRPFLLLLKF